MTPAPTRHPNQEYQTLYAFTQNIIGEKAFHELPIITDPQILNHIAPRERIDNACFKGKNIARLCRGSYADKYSILFFECMNEEKKIPFFVTDCSMPGVHVEWFSSGMFPGTSLFFRNPELKRFLGELLSDFATDAVHGYDMKGLRYHLTLPPFIKL